LRNSVEHQKFGEFISQQGSKTARARVCKNNNKSHKLSTQTKALLTILELKNKKKTNEILYFFSFGLSFFPIELLILIQSFYS